MKLNEITRESWAVALRDLYKNYNIWKELSLIILVAAIILGLGKGIILFSGKSDSSYLSFFGAGIIGYMIIVATLAVGVDFVIDKKGWSRILLVMPISRISILFGKTIYLILSAIKSYFIISIILLIYLKEITFLKVFLLIPLIIILVLIFIGISFLASAFINRRETAQTFISIGAMICLLFSGTIYKISAVPHYLQFLFYINPATYGIESVRYIMTGTSSMNLVLLCTVMLGMLLIFPVLGIFIYEKKLRMN
jgi:ABC-2 type transport system permease protein